LLRALETSEIRPVGSTKVRRVNVRIISASHRDLVQMASEGAFRDDLRYRLQVVRLEVPPLRERMEDMPELCEYLLQDARRRYGLNNRRLSPEAFTELCRRRWAGNVRELRHVLASAAIAAEGDQIQVADLPPEVVAPASQTPAAAASSSTPPFASADGHELRADSIRGALRVTLGHKGRAAELLGISRSTLYRYMETYGIDSKESGRPGSIPPDAESTEPLDD
jgi:DNA-binding NtrC family response regulator